MYRTIQPEIREKVNSAGEYAIRLERSITRLSYTEVFSIRALKSSMIWNIAGASWVDWDQQGRLVIAQDGKVFAGSIHSNGRVEKKLLLDLNASKPELLAPPNWAMKW